MLEQEENASIEGNTAPEGDGIIGQESGQAVHEHEDGEAIIAVTEKVSSYLWPQFQITCIDHFVTVCFLLKDGESSENAGSS